MKFFIIMFIVALPFLMDLWRDQCEYWELCRKQKEEEARVQAIVNLIDDKK